MARSRYEKLRQLYLKVVDLPEGARNSALEGEEPDLRAEVLAMLKTRSLGGGILDRELTVDMVGTTPERIGPYQIIRPLGRGGMGEVYLARQEGDLRREVAVKRIPSGSRFRERFEAERLLLARLKHPNIAAVYDAGDDGTAAWLAMEFVDGPTVDEWVRKTNPPLRQRLEIVQQICAGVGHAHQKGVLHRDLKPSNLLVADVDGQPSVRIIDFGVAKALQELDGITRGRTVVGQLLGTPEYMSPEQTELQPELVDTRSDIYSIGVILYKLLCGRLPHPGEDLLGLGLTQLRQRLVEHTPPPPSKHDASVNRELDWICARALAKDPEERFQTPGELAEDLHRWLDGKAVESAPPSPAYRVRKFIRRHKLAFGGGAAIFLILAIGLLGTSLSLVRARKAEKQALAESQRANQASEFLLGLFEDADPTLGGARDEIAEWVLRRGESSLAALENPDLRRSVTSTIGRLYDTLGLYEEAAPLLEESLQAATSDGDDLERSRAQYLLGINDSYRGRYEQADSLLAAAQFSAETAESGTESVQLQAKILSWRASNFTRLGRLNEALLTIRASTNLFRELETNHWQAIADNFQTESAVLRRMGNYEEALAVSNQGLKTLEENGREEYPQFAAGLHTRANLFEGMERFEESIADFERSRAIWIRSFGETHPHVASSYSSQSTTYYAMGQYEKMEEMAGRALEIQQQLSGEDHPQLAQHLINRSVARLSMNVFAGVEEDLERAKNIYEKAYDGPHPNIASVLDNLSYFYQAQGRQTEALDALRKTMEIRIQTLGPRHRQTLASQLKYAESLRGNGRAKEARRLAGELLPLLEKVRGPEHAHSERARALLTDK